MNETYEAHLPRQMYGYQRSDVKLLVVSDLFVRKSKLTEISDYLSPGDLLIFNNSKLVPSSLDVYNDVFQRFATINVGTDRKGSLFLTEVRPKGFGGQIVDRTSFSIIGSEYRINLVSKHERFPRFWWAELDDGSVTIDSLLKDSGKYVRYDHIPFSIPNEYYEGVFYKIPGSVELPSASYAFDSGILEKIERKGVNISELTLHCNLGSMEYPEFKNKNQLLPEGFSVPLKTLRTIYGAKRRGNRVIAVGTTVVRALESLYINGVKLADEEDSLDGPGSDDAIEGTTDIYIDRSYRLKLIDGIVTGMHESDGSHIRMLEAFQKRERIREAYRMAAEWGFQYHEFGDLALVFRNGY